MTRQSITLPEYIAAPYFCEDKTDFQKYLFLYTQICQAKEDRDYNFVPYYVNKETEPMYSSVRKELKDGVTVPDGHIFVMGDNRNHSRDSRDGTIGFVPVNDVLGKVIGT